MITNLKKAFDYVNQRHVFNPEDYPVIKKLTEQEKQVFKLIYILLDLQQQMWNISAHETILEALSIKPPYQKNYVKAFSKVVADFMVLAKIAGIEGDEFVKVQPYSLSPYRHIKTDCEVTVALLGKECNIAHHGNDLNIKRVKEIILESWAEILYRFEREKISLPLEYILSDGKKELQL